MALSTRTVWLITALIAGAIAVTYSRVDLDELYHVSHSGLRGGLGRALVFANFPAALVAIATVPIAVDGRTSPAVRWLGLGAVALCGVTAIPGVVEQGDLDPKPINLVPAAGVAVALALSLAKPERATRAGWARLAAFLVLLGLSLPWIAADLGLHFGAGVFLTDELRTQPGSVEAATAVHLGHHHGLDGALFVFGALALWPNRRRLASAHLAVGTHVYLSAMLVYGAVNFAQDLWLEQVVKRGWTDSEIPNALQPGLTPIWGLMVLAAGSVVLVDRWLQSGRRQDASLTGPDRR